MKRVGKSLPERLGSSALRFVAPLARGGGRGRPRLAPWLLISEAEGDVPVGDGPTARTDPAARLEAILFLAREPMGTRKLAQLADLADGTEARTLIRKLNVLYDREECAFRAVEVAGGFQLMTRPQFAPYLRRLHGPAAEVRLSAPAMETLAVVAYRQPVLRTTIESIRGVQCGELLRQLMERDLVRVAGRSDELGRPFLYGTTKRFLQVFGLRHIDGLPPAETELPIDEPAEPRKNQQDMVDAGEGVPAPTAEARLTEEEPTVKIQIESQESPSFVEEPSPSGSPLGAPVLELADESDFEEEEFDDDYDDEEDDEDYDYDEEDEEGSEEEYDDYDEEEEDDEEDDGFQDSDWEEVDDEEEEEDWDEEEDEEEDDWDEEEEDDWDDEEEEGWDEEDEDEDDDWD